jgi:shikimate kinase
MRHVLLIGFMGSGKSTVGPLVAERLDREFVDLDECIAQREGRSVPAIFAESGEAAFRAAESAALDSIADMPPSVIACGGGVVLDDANRAALGRLGYVVYLQVSAEEALARIGDTSGRPLLAGAGSGAGMASALLRSREALYEATADLRVRTSGRAPEEVADDVVSAAEDEAA